MKMKLGRAAPPPISSTNVSTSCRQFSVDAQPSGGASKRQRVQETEPCGRDGAVGHGPPYPSGSKLGRSHGEPPVKTNVLAGFVALALTSLALAAPPAEAAQPDAKLLAAVKACDKDARGLLERL